MQMQDGIGRGGYRLLAIVFAGLGLLGLATTLAAFGRSDLEGLFKWLGFILSAVALVALLSLVLVILSGPRPARARPAPEPEPDEDLEPLPEPMGEQSNPGIEFTDIAPQTPAAPEPEPFVPGPPPRVQPPPPPFVHPPNRPEGKGWPERPARSGMTRGEALKLQQGQATTTAAEAAPAPPKNEGPLIVARTATSPDTSRLPDNVGIGKCGHCNVLLLAPKRRPMRLQCPNCKRIHALT